MPYKKISENWLRCKKHGTLFDGNKMLKCFRCRIEDNEVYYKQKIKYE